MLYLSTFNSEFYILFWHRKAVFHRSFTTFSTLICRLWFSTMQFVFFLVILHLLTYTQVVGFINLSHESGEMVKKIREMFDFGYSNYMKYAYPKDELDPIHCCGRGHDFTDPYNINVNDALGDYQLTLVDSLDSLAVSTYSYHLFRRCRYLVT